MKNKYLYNYNFFKLRFIDYLNKFNSTFIVFDIEKTMNKNLKKLLYNNFYYFSSYFIKSRFFITKNRYLWGNGINYAFFKNNCVYSNVMFIYDNFDYFSENYIRILGYSNNGIFVDIYNLLNFVKIYNEYYNKENIFFFNYIYPFFELNMEIFFVVYIYLVRFFDVILFELCPI